MPWPWTPKGCDWSIASRALPPPSPSASRPNRSWPPSAPPRAPRRPNGAPNSECGAGALDYATWSDGLTLWFQTGTFAGWAVNEAGPTLMSGIGVGSSRADLEGAHVIQVEQSTLGTEFASAGFYGILEAGRVSNLWAGVSCNFR